MKLPFYCLIMLSCNLLTAQSETVIDRFLIQLKAVEAEFEPDSTFNWNKGYYILTEDKMQQRAVELQMLVTKLEVISNAELSRQDQISKSILLMKLQNEISEVVYLEYLMPFNAEGGFYNQAAFFLRNRSFSSFEDYQDYLTWMQSYVDYLRFNLTLLKKGVAQGVMRPKVIVKNTLELLQTWVAEPEMHPLYEPFLLMSDEIEGPDQYNIQREGLRVLQEHVLPVYQELELYFREVYLPKSPQRVGIDQIANGNAYYEDRVCFFTTLDISSDSVFQLGQSEVSRIRGQMEAIISEVGFKGDFAQFIDFLRSDDQFYAQSASELLSRAAWLSKKAEGQLPKLFSKLYELPFTVEPVPDAIAPTYTGGRYVPGRRSMNQAGIYWVNTYNLPSRPFYTLPALTLHEAVPGHHLQIMMASELEDVPEFRRNYYISAYGEGWGLYSEYLGEEMGMYETPYDLFGRYTYEMWRACRLVVDVGLHTKGWSRTQAVEFLAGNTALSLHEVNTEIDRYIGWPGQALSYKIGELNIKSMRQKAQDQLGDQFDIQKFHRCVLKNGAIPLSELQREVETYILETLQKD